MLRLLTLFLVEVPLAVAVTVVGGLMISNETGSLVHVMVMPGLMAASGAILSGFLSGPWLGMVRTVGKVVNYFTLGLPVFPLLVHGFFGLTLCFPGFVVGLVAGVFANPPAAAWAHMLISLLVSSVAVGFLSIIDSGYPIPTKKE